MQKKELKNFVCSFLLSLVAVATISKGILRMSSSSQTKAPSTVKVQNISLFRDAAEPVSAETPAQPEKNVDVSAIETLTAVKPVLKEEKIRQARAELPKLDLLPQSKEPLSTAPVYAPEPDIRTDLASAEEIELDDTEDPFDFRQAEPVILADISDTLQDEKIQNALSRKPIYEPEEEAEIKQTQSQKILASLDLQDTADALGETDELSLIPLEENAEILQPEIMPVLHAPSAQIAMLEPNTLVNTIDTMDFEEEKSLDEVDLKQDELATTSAPESDSPWVTAEARTEMPTEDATASSVSETAEAPENPWVIARGNKFAKNKTVVEQFATSDTPKAPQKAKIPNQQIDNTDSKSVELPKEELTSSVSGQIVLQEESQTLALEADTTDTADTSDTQTLSAVREALQPQPLLRPIGEDTKLAYQMIDNLLIPIPEDIKNDANLTPDLSVTPNEKPKEKPKPTPISEATPQNNSKAQTPIKTTALSKPELKESDKDSGLFKSIANWFSPKSGDKKVQETKEQPVQKTRKSTKKSGINFFRTSKDAENSDDDAPNIMPAELRLSFQPNRAEISGQTLRWIHAFADNARDNNDVYIEVRIDGTSSFALQQKRLNLLKTILANRGVDYRKINIIFTSREPNSFIIRNIRFNNREEVVVDSDKSNSYYRPW